MNKCNLTYDLLPSYINHLTSPSTNEFIEEHLNNCNECKETYEMMIKDIGEVGQKEKENVDFLVKIRKSYLVKWAVSLACIVALMIGLVYLSNEKTIPISSEHVTLKEVYELKDGRIYYSLDIVGAGQLTCSAEGTGVFFKEELKKDIQESYYFLSLKHTIWDSIFHSSKNSVRTEWRIIDLTQELKGEFWVKSFDGRIITRDVKKAYYQGRDEKDRILIWEEGMEILPAPQEIEEFAIAEDRWISESYTRNK